MIDAQNQILSATQKLVAWEKGKAELEALKEKVSDLKNEFDDAIASCEAAGLTKAKARKAVSGLMEVLAEADIIDLPDSKPKAPKRGRVSKAAKDDADGQKNQEEDVSDETSADDDTSLAGETSAPEVPAETDDGVAALPVEEAGNDANNSDEAATAVEEEGADKETEVVEIDDADVEIESPEIEDISDIAPESSEIDPNEEFGVADDAAVETTGDESEVDVFEAPEIEEAPVEEPVVEKPVARPTFQKPAFLKNRDQN